MLQAASRFWVVPQLTDLTKVIDTKKVYVTDHKVTLDMTTNRTGKPGDDILATPALLGEMTTMLCSILDTMTPKRITPVTKHIQLKHRRPLKWGKDFKIQAQAAEVDKHSVTFNVKGISDSDEVIGEGKILLEIVRNE